jgi:hypothetical protein
MYTLAFATGALALQLTTQQLDEWNVLKSMSVQVADRDCSGEIVNIIQKSSEVYGQSGLSEEFVKSLDNIKIVAGDIPEADGFRNKLSNVTTVISDYYRQQVEIMKSISLAAQQTSTTTAESYATKTGGAAKETNAPAATDPNYGVQSIGGDENPVYGVMSSAKQAGYALTGLGMLAALFL